jgi:GDP-L-fucose synthase
MDYRSVMTTNIKGPNDNFHPKDSHVIPALLRRFHEAKLNGAESVTIWGTGNAKREFLHVDDLADACLFIMQSAQPMLSHINIGTGTEVTIRELAETIKQVTGFNGELRFDTNQPDSTPRKLLDVSKINALGWQAKIGLLEGLSKTYQWFNSQS